jgi:hypothetical protein
MSATMTGRMARGIVILAPTPVKRQSFKAMAASITPIALQREQRVLHRSIAANRDMAVISTDMMMVRPANRMPVIDLALIWEWHVPIFCR